MGSGILYQASVLTHGKEPVNHWLRKGFKNITGFPQFYLTAEETGLEKYGDKVSPSQDLSLDLLV